jgi:hypothetical protein
MALNFVHYVWVEKTWDLVWICERTREINCNKYIEVVKKQVVRLPVELVAGVTVVCLLFIRSLEKPVFIYQTTRCHRADWCSVNPGEVLGYTPRKNSAILQEIFCYSPQYLRSYQNIFSIRARPLPSNSFYHSSDILPFDGIVNK